MYARHLEERREMFMGEVLVYYVTVYDDHAPVDDSNPYCEGGRCRLEPETPIRVVAEAPVVAKRVPGKAEFIRLFAFAGALPACVRETRAIVTAFVEKAQGWFGDDRDGMPRRVRGSLARLDLADPASWYSTGDIARVAHYLYDHQGRVFIAEHATA